MVVLCHSQQQAEQVKARLAEWLAPRGLAFNEDKTQIVHLGEGFDFLGFNVRRYRNRKLLIKPCKAAIRRLRERLAAEMRTLRGGERGGGHRHAQPRHPGLGRLLPGRGVDQGVLRAGSPTCGSSPTSGPHGSHHNKPKHWIVGRYFGKYNKFRNDRWVFGDRDSGTYLVKFSWTGIDRHVMVKGAASPDDPALTSYWAERRQEGETPARQRTPCAC